MNEIAEVEFETNLPLFFDSYAENRGTGALILIDGVTNATVGAGMIVAAMETSSETAARTVLVWVPEQKTVAEQRASRRCSFAANGRCWWTMH